MGDSASLERLAVSANAGRAKLVRLVVRRLHAEGQLDPCWSIDTAGDFVSSVTSATYAFELLAVRGWAVTDLRTRLLHVLQAALLCPSQPTPRNTSDVN